jgi:REP element-mobilizing transposase RayT
MYFNPMPRKRRFINPGEIHHVMSRGLDGMPLFLDDEDREKFIKTTGNIFIDGSCHCYAWVLMDNHYHFVIRPLDHSLQKIMRRINGSYARYFNKKYNRRGYVFQDRFKSVATQEYWYLKELIRYVNLNPLRAGIVKSIDELVKYKWSGHCEIMGLVKGCGWFSAISILERFGKTIAESRLGYMEWLRAGIGSDTNGWMAAENTISDNAINENLLHKEVQKVMQLINSANNLNKNENQKPGLESLFESVCKEQEISVTIARTRGRSDRRSNVKSTFCKKAINEFGYTIASVAQYLGVNSSSVLRRIK